MSNRNAEREPNKPALKIWQTPAVITPADVASDTLDLKGIFATFDHYTPGLHTFLS